MATAQTFDEPTAAIMIQRFKHARAEHDRSPVIQESCRRSGMSQRDWAFKRLAIEAPPNLHAALYDLWDRSADA